MTAHPIADFIIYASALTIIVECLLRKGGA